VADKEFKCKHTKRLPIDVMNKLPIEKLLIFYSNRVVFTTEVRGTDIPTAPVYPHKITNWLNANIEGFWVMNDAHILFEHRSDMILFLTVYSTFEAKVAT
jgi:hypothetical protein